MTTTNPNAPNEDNKIPLSNALIQAIGDYLITKPYREVAQLISGLQTEVQAAVAAVSGTKANGAGVAVETEPQQSMGELQ